MDRSISRCEKKHPKAPGVLFINAAKPEQEKNAKRKAQEHELPVIEN
jgi:hypothetical protein